MLRLHVSFVDAAASEGCLAVGALEGGRFGPAPVDVAVKRRVRVQGAQLRETSMTNGADIRLLMALINQGFLSTNGR